MLGAHLFPPAGEDARESWADEGGDASVDPGRLVCRGMSVATTVLSTDDFLALLRPFGRIDRLLLAVSGGPDSVALMGLAAAAAPVGAPLAVATVDHRLRSESGGEAQAVARAAAALGLPHAVLEWHGLPPKTRIQERARAARYDLLVAHARAIGASHLATAHTLDDQAETILQRLARGSGPAGLIGMRPSTRRDGIVHLRPLLGVRKAQLVATCRVNGWAFHDDPSNADPRYTRSRWRTILPQLEAEGLQPARLAVLSDRLGRAEAALAVQAGRAYAAVRVACGEASLAFDAPALAAEPEEIVLRVLARALAEVGAGAPPRLQRLERLVRALRPAMAAGCSLKRTLAGAIVWARSDGTLRISRESARAASPVQRRIEGASVDHETNWSA